MTLSESWSAFWGFLGDYTTPSKRSEFWWSMGFTVSIFLIFKILMSLLVFFVAGTLSFSASAGGVGGEVPGLASFGIFTIVEIVLAVGLFCFEMAVLFPWIALSSRRLVDAGYPVEIAISIAALFGISLLLSLLLPAIAGAAVMFHYSLLSVSFVTNPVVTAVIHYGLQFSTLVIIISAFLPSVKSSEWGF